MNCGYKVYPYIWHSRVSIAIACLVTTSLVRFMLITQWVMGSLAIWSRHFEIWILTSLLLVSLQQKFQSNNLRIRYLLISKSTDRFINLKCKQVLHNCLLDKSNIYWYIVFSPFKQLLGSLIYGSYSSRLTNHWTLKSLW